MQSYKTQNLPEQKSHSKKAAYTISNSQYDRCYLKQNPHFTVVTRHSLFSLLRPNLVKKIYIYNLRQISDVIKREITLAGAQISGETKHRMS